MTCHQIIYTSRPTVKNVESMLLCILKTAQTENYKHKISGLLIYHHGKFMQLLEGDEAELNNLYSNISRDPRHTDLRVVLEREDSKRCFAAWAMGFGMTGSHGDVFSNQEFYFSTDDIKDICSALNNEVGRYILNFLDSESAD